MIEGVSPAGRDGFIVLDDLSMTPSCERSSNQELPGGSQVTTPQPACFPGQLMCLNKNCYNPVETCNFIDDCGDNTDERFCSKFFVQYCLDNIMNLGRSISMFE